MKLSGSNIAGATKTLGNSMLNMTPVVRGTIYVALVVVTIAAIILGEVIPNDVWTRAIERVADYLAVLAGGTALSHINANRSPIEKP